MPDWLKDRLKELLSAIISGMVPAGTLKWSQFLPFTNAQVPADLGLVASAFAVVLALILCVHSRFPRPPSAALRSSTIIAFACFGLAALGLVALLFLSNQLVSFDPGWESFANHIAYLITVVPLGAPIGWVASRAF